MVWNPNRVERYHVRMVSSPLSPFVTNQVRGSKLNMGAYHTLTLATKLVFRHEVPLSVVPNPSKLELSSSDSYRTKDHLWTYTFCFYYRPSKGTEVSPTYSSYQIWVPS